MTAFFENILLWLNQLMGNYGWAVVLFTLLVRLVLMPFDYKSRVSMRKTAALQPKIAALQAKYGKDQEKLNRKMSELYKQEKVSPLSGCLPMLLSYPILILMFNAMRNMANEQMVRQVAQILQNPDTIPELTGWLWIKNLWMPDSPFCGVLPDMNMLRVVPAEIWQRVLTSDILSALPAELGLTVESFARENLNASLQTLFGYLASTNAYVQASAAVPGWGNLPVLGLTTITVFQHYNGLLLLPVLSALSQLIMTKLTPTSQPAAAPDSPQAQSAQSTGKFMTYFFPIFTLWICITSNGAFALYWFASNLIMMAQTFFINRYLDSKQKNAAEATSAEGKVI